MKITEWLVPQDKAFYSLLEEQGRLIQETVRHLFSCGEKGILTEDDVRAIADLEKQGDEIAHKIYHHLNETFITPVDHEDIAELANGGDDVLDLVYNLVSRLWVYQFDLSRPFVKKFFRILRDMAEENFLLVNKLSRLDQKELHEHAERIHTFENEGDDLINEVLAVIILQDDIRLFVIEKDIYEMCEEVSDLLETFCHTVQNVVMKNL